MHIAGCFRRSIIVPHLCHRLPPMLFIGRSGNTVDRSLTRWVRSWRPVPAARPFGQGGMLPRYPFIRLSMNPEDYFSPHPLFHTFFGFDSPSVGTFFQGKSSHPIFHTFLWFERKVFQKNFLTLYSTLFSRLDEKIIKLFCGKTVGTLSTLLIESEKHLSRNLFSDKEKAEKENRIGRFPSAHSGNDSRRNGNISILFVVLFLFLYIFFLLYSSHWGFMVNPPMVHLIQTLPPWLQRY